MSETRPQTRDAAVRAFVARTYGLGGTLRLHSAAIGLDLLRAPVNVALAPVFLTLRLLALVARQVGLARIAAWLAGRRVFFEMAVSRVVEARVAAFLEDLARDGLGVAAPPEAIAVRIRDYAAIRSAVAEITTSLCVLAAGLMLFGIATPGVVSLTGPIADRMAQAQAIANFPLGQGLGGVWYGVFPTGATGGDMLATGLALALAASIVTTFAGVIADPVQVATGTHRRRLMRLLDRLDRDGEGAPGLAGEHLLARAGDLSDMIMSALRALRG